MNRQFKRATVGAAGTVCFMFGQWAASQVIRNGGIHLNTIPFILMFMGTSLGGALVLQDAVRDEI